MQSNSIPPHDHEQPRRFLELLGKDPAACWFRTIRHGKGANSSRKGADLQGLDLAALTRDNNAGDAVYLVVGDAAQASGKGGGVKDADITTVPALFVEWDDKPMDWQVNAWQTLGLPEPSLMVASGGKSLHCYWLLDQPLEPVEWRRITALLIAHCASDSSCCNPSRVMRLPGFAYIDKATCKPTGTIAEILHESDNRYSAAEIEACIPAPQQQAIPTPAAAGRRGEWDPRGIEEIRAAAEYIPARIGGKRTYEQDRRALCGCAAALAAIGRPEEEALDLLASKWPDRGAAQQVLSSSTTREAASFWAIAKDHGYNLRRTPDPLDGFGVIDQGTATPQAPAHKAPLLSLDEVRQVLDEGVCRGIGGTDLAVLVADLATRSERHSSEIHRIAQQVEKDHQSAQEIEAERRALAEENDRKEISEHITAAMLLPAEIAEALDTCTASLPTDGPSKVLPFLATIAGLVKLGTEVKVLAGYTAPINLYACLVADSGAKKSPVGKLLVERPIAPLVLEIAQQNDREHRKWEEDCRGIKKDERPPQPVPRRIKASGATGEALATRLQAQEAAGLGLLIHRDELAGLFRALDAYRGGRGDDEQQLLEIYDGGGLTALRVGGDRHFSRSQVAIYGTTQPRILKKLVANGDDSGLWARFLFCPLPAKVMPLPPQETRGAIERFDAAAAVLADACRFIYTLPPAIYRLSPEAYERFRRFEEDRQREGLATTISAQGALYNKSAGKVIRVAGLIHLLRIAAGDVGTADEIAANCIDRAVMLVTILDSWALSFHAEIAAGGGASLMRNIHTIAWKERKPMSWKEIRDRLSQTQRKGATAAAAAAAMRALAADGYGVTDAGARGGLVYTAFAPMP